MAEGMAQYKSTASRLVLFACLAFLMAGVPAFAQQAAECSGARFMQIASTMQGVALCGIFGPYACAGYAAIVAVYEMVVWFQSGC